MSCSNDGTPREIRNFESAQNPYNILLLFDRSSSTEEQWPFLTRAIVRFLDQMPPQHQVALAAFDDKPEMLFNWRSANELKSLGFTIQTNNSGTDVYRALEWAAGELRRVKGRKGVIAFTDGVDNRLSKKLVSFDKSGTPSVARMEADNDFQKMLRTLGQSNAPVYFVAVNTDQNPDPSVPPNSFDLKQREAARLRMETVANRSNGVLHLPKQIGDVGSLYERIGKELGYSYSSHFRTRERSARWVIPPDRNTIAGQVPQGDAIARRILRPVKLHAKMHEIHMIFARLAVILVAVSASVAVAAQQEFQLKVNVSLVSVDVGVYDRKGEAVTTLKKEDFLILEDDQPQEIRAFEPSGVAFNALLVVDQSGSMRGAWDSMVSGLNRFMEVLRAQDRVAIAAFDNGVEMASKWRSAKSGRQEKVGISPDGIGTDFYGAMIWAAGYIRGEKGRKGVIVFSDGQQSRSFDSNLQQALERVRQVNVPFYFVGYNTSPASASEMKQLAEASGGRAYFPQAVEELVGIYEQIGRDLGRAYSIGYMSPKVS